MYPYEENAFFFTNFDCFPRKGTFFYLFFYLSDFKRVKKVYLYEENAFFKTNFDCFPRKGTLFLFFFSIYQISKE